MQRTGLVSQKRDARDARRSIVELTEAGRALVAELLPDSRAREAALLGALTPDERATFDRLLSKLQNRANELRGDLA
jgi:DNA-binding MarR family transcriptional regulator